MPNKKKEELHDSLKKIVKTSVLVFIGVILSKILTYVYRGIIARKFGAEAFGLFSLALVALGWFSSIASFGLDSGLSRYIPLYRGKDQKEKIKYIFKHVLSIYLISGLAFGILLFIFSETISLNIFHEPQLIPFLRIFAVVLPISLFVSPLLGTLKAYEKIGWHSFIFNIFQNLTKVVLLVLLIIIGFKSNSIAWSYLFGTIGMVLLAYIILKKYVPEIFGKVNLPDKEKKDLSKKLWNFSLPLLFFSIIGSIFYWVDTFMLGYYKGAEAVGFYSAAVTILVLLLMAYELLSPLFFPLVMKAYARRKTIIIKDLSKQLSKWVFMINLPIAILIFIFPGAFINILYGSEFLAASSALRIMVIGTFFSSVLAVSTQLMYVSGRSKLILLNMIIATIVNFILNVLLIPLPKILFIENAGGLEGAAISTTLSLILLNLLFALQAKKHFSFIPLKRKMITIMLISILPTIILVYLRNLVSMTVLPMIFICGFYFLLYFGLLFLSKSFDENDWMILRAIWGKTRQIHRDTKNYISGSEAEISN